MLVVSLQARPDGEKAAVLCTVHRCMLAAEENETGPRLGQGESMFVNYSLCVCGVCVYVCVVCAGMYTPVLACICVHVYYVWGILSVCVCVCTYVCMYVCVCSHARAYRRMGERRKKV